MPRAVRRAATAAVEFAVGRAGIAAVRVLDRDAIGQGHRPRGAAGSVTGWVFAHRPSNRQRNRWVVSLLGVQPTDRVLEIGFGPGVAVAELVRAGAGHVYGADHSPVMLRQASRRNAAAIRSAAGEIEDLLRSAGFTQLRTEILPLSPPVACVLAGDGGCGILVEVADDDRGGDQGGPPSQGEHQ